jgi:hypothetical protein
MRDQITALEARVETIIRILEKWQFTHGKESN